MTHPIASRRTFLKLSAALAGTALLPETGAFAAGGDAARRTVIIDTDPGRTTPSRSCSRWARTTGSTCAR